MFKKIISYLVIFSLFSIIVPTTVYANKPLMPFNNPYIQEELKGVWVATVLNLDYPNRPTTEVAVLKREADAILDRAVTMGLNAVFLQVRPSGDAFYKSPSFPWSNYLTGKQGLPPSENFDPLDYWVQAAHSRGIALHAWLNPYRVTYDSFKTSSEAFASLAPSNPANLRKDLVVFHTDGRLYFNPGLPEARQLLIDEIAFLVQNYKIDGIHFDDYFYPGTEFEDNDAYISSKTSLTRADWRRDNNTRLIKGVYDTIRSIRKDVQFGVSPFGIWANKKDHPQGSDTRGNQSYFSHYADTKLWVKEGMLDYIMPQLYWHIGFDIADYTKLLSWWDDVVKGTDVALYIGHAAYRTGNTSTSSPWYGEEEILRQLRLNKTYPSVKGSVYFREKFFLTRPTLMNAIKGFYSNQTPTQPTNTIGNLSVTNPPSDLRTTNENYFVSGISDPNSPLYFNGVLVENRSTKGYFGVYASLKSGENKLVFSQGSKSVTRIITRGGSSVPPTTMPSAEITQSSTYPQKHEMWLEGEEVTLSCIAPVGATVTVTLNGETLKLTPRNTAKAGSTILPTTYSVKYKLPIISSSRPTLNLGVPVYRMTYNSSSKQTLAPATVSVIRRNAPFYARVTEDLSDTYLFASTSRGAAHMLHVGVIDQITAISGDFVRFANGFWIRKSNVSLFVDLTDTKNSILNVDYRVTQTHDSIEFKTSEAIASTVKYEKGLITLELPITPTLKSFSLPSNALLSEVKLIENPTTFRSEYQFKLVQANALHGYYIEPTSDGFRLMLKRPVGITVGLNPLKGIKILVDPGHGGKDPGALGILRGEYAEKHINMDTSIRLKHHLESLGATVWMTRDRDIDLSLQERLRLSYRMKPDLFISMHANSIGPELNINNIAGFSVHYKDEIARLASDSVLKTVIETLSRKSRGVKIDNFYVVRGTWTPSILLETGFVPNPLEFEWLSEPMHQDELAREIARGILGFFSRTYK